MFSLSSINWINMILIFSVAVVGTFVIFSTMWFVPQILGVIIPLVILAAFIAGFWRCNSLPY